MIKLLDTHTINKIAAGEVVERPASVVKELVENSIDAKSSTITVEIKNGGVELIRITDNGKGIPKDEVEMAFLRHATSKITSADDLYHVLSLGFRGEALASVAAVAHVELMTKTPGEMTGKRVEVHGGKLQSSEEIACPEGTTLIMRQLFYNVPARKSFLKSMGTEAAKISDYMYKLALAHPEISFKYIQNNKLVFTTSGNGDLKQCVFQLYGKEIAKSILPIYYQEDGITLSGVVGKPTLTRANRQYEHFFINGRYIKSALLQRGLEEAYKTLIMVGKFPFSVIHLQIHPEEVDVNVHPTKLEVKFKDPERLEQFVAKGVRKHLRKEVLIPEAESIQNKLNLKPTPTEIPIEQVRVESFFGKYTPPKPYQPNEVIDHQQIVSQIKDNGDDKDSTDEQSNEIVKHWSVEEINLKEAQIHQEDKCPTSNTQGIQQTTQVPYSVGVRENLIEEVVLTYDLENRESNSSYNREQGKPITYDGSKDFVNHQPTQNRVDEVIQEPLEQKDLVYKLKEGIDYRIVGQLLKTYWLVEIDNKVLMIDQHAAHERIMYERYMIEFSKSQVATQLLLFPETIHLSPMDYNKVQENEALFQQLGFGIELFGQNQIIVREVPYLFNHPVPVTVLEDLLSEIRVDQTTNIYTLQEEKIIRMSCRSAVKANDTLSESECKTLIESLLNLENPYTCPHGRPTIVTLKRTDLEKIFKRIQ